MAPDISTIAKQIREHVVRWFLDSEQARILDDSDDLRSILSSLRVLNLVLHLEQTYRFKIDERDITPENFGSIAKISSYVARRIE